MGLVHGAYDAKAEGFLPGGASLHNCMTGARPRRRDLEARNALLELKPHKIEDTMAFMFESRFAMRLTRYAIGILRAAARLLRRLAGAEEAFFGLTIDCLRGNERILTTRLKRPALRRGWCRAPS